MYHEFQIGDEVVFTERMKSHYPAAASCGGFDGVAIVVTIGRMGWEVKAKNGERWYVYYGDIELYQTQKGQMKLPFRFNGRK